jgi:hypothetical protein
VKKPAEGEGIRRADGLAIVGVVPPKLEGLTCGFLNFTEPLVSSCIEATAGTCNK